MNDCLIVANLDRSLTGLEEQLAHSCERSNQLDIALSALQSEMEVMKEEEHQLLVENEAAQEKKTTALEVAVRSITEAEESLQQVQAQKLIIDDIVLSVQSEQAKVAKERGTFYF